MEDIDVRRTNTRAVTNIEHRCSGNRWCAVAEEIDERHIFDEQTAIPRD